MARLDGRRHGAGDAVADARHAGLVRRVHARASPRTTRVDTANVISTAGDATLSVADPSRDGHRPPGQRHVLAARSRCRPGPQRGQHRPAFNNVGGSASPLNLLTYSGPVSNDAVTLAFKQPISANDALRTGTLQQDADVHALDDEPRKREFSQRHPASRGVPRAISAGRLQRTLVRFLGRRASLVGMDRSPVHDRRRRTAAALPRRVGANARRPPRCFWCSLC